MEDLFEETVLRTWRDGSCLGSRERKNAHAGNNMCKDPQENPETGRLCHHERPETCRVCKERDS